MNDTITQENINRFTPSQIINLRLNTCRNCIYSVCQSDGNSSNKCNINDLVCSKDKNKSIIVKANNINETCPMGYWDFTNVQKKVFVSRKKGCGCKH